MSHTLVKELLLFSPIGVRPHMSSSYDNEYLFFSDNLNIVS